MSDLADEMRGLATRRFQSLEALVAPARAAANQMRDAGMKAGSEPLLEALFKYDAAQQEMEALVRRDPAAALEVLIASFGQK